MGLYNVCITVCAYKGIYNDKSWEAMPLYRHLRSKNYLPSLGSFHIPKTSLSDLLSVTKINRENSACVYIRSDKLCQQMPPTLLHVKVICTFRYHLESGIIIRQNMIAAEKKFKNFPTVTWCNNVTLIQFHS